MLPASSYPFVYAYPDTKAPSWIDAHVKAFEYFGGVTRVVIPDNTKTAVVKTDLFDPSLNKSYQEMAKYYRTSIIPARVAKPKDKAADENMVGRKKPKFNSITMLITKISFTASITPM